MSTWAELITKAVTALQVTFNMHQAANLREVHGASKPNLLKRVVLFLQVCSPMQESIDVQHMSLWTARGAVTPEKTHGLRITCLIDYGGGSAFKNAKLAAHDSPLCRAQGV